MLRLSQSIEDTRTSVGVSGFEGSGKLTESDMGNGPCLSGVLFGQVAQRGFEAGMPEQSLYRPRGRAVFVQRGRERLPPFVQKDMTADRMRGAGAALFIDTLTAVDPGTQREVFDDPQHVAVRLIARSRENQARMRVALLTCNEPLNHAIGQGNRTLFFVLRDEPQVKVFGHLVAFPRKIYVGPAGVLDLLLTRSGAEEESKQVGLIHRGVREHHFDGVILVGADFFLRVLRHVFTL